jgi:hypothetical protein
VPSVRRAADDELSAANEACPLTASWTRVVDGELSAGGVEGGDLRIGDFGEGGNSDGSSGRSESGELTAGNEEISAVVWKTPGERFSI